MKKSVCFFTGLLLLFYACQPESEGVQIDMNRLFKTRVIESKAEAGKKAVYKATQLGIGDYQDSTASFSIFLKDGNANNIYDEVGIDEIVITQFGIDTLGSVLHGVNKLTVDSTSKYIRVNDRFFEIKKVDPKGTYITLLPLDTAGIDADLYMMDRLPALDFELLSGEKSNFHDYLHKGKYVYVEIWGIWCPGCLKIIKELRTLHQTHQDKLTIISLNYKDDLEEAQQFATLNTMNWIQGISTEALNTAFVQTGFPFGVLFDSQGNLVKLGITTEEIIALLETAKGEANAVEKYK